MDSSTHLSVTVTSQISSVGCSSSASAFTLVILYKRSIKQVKRFFLYLADGSFLSIHATENELSELLDNFPEWEQLYPVPFEKIKALDIPSVTMGVYGKDGHNWTERVYKPYTFNVLPGLIRKTTSELFRAHRD